MNYAALILLAVTTCVTQANCIIFPIDKLSGNDSLLYYIASTPEAKRVPLNEVIGSVRIYEKNNPGDELVAYCAPEAPVYEMENFHCVDRPEIPLDDAGRFVCQHDADENNLGFWTEDGEWEAYLNPCPNDQADCEEAHIIERDLFGNMQ